MENGQHPIKLKTQRNIYKHLLKGLLFSILTVPIWQVNNFICHVCKQSIVYWKHIYIYIYQYICHIYIYIYKYIYITYKHIFILSNTKYFKTLIYDICIYIYNIYILVFKNISSKYRYFLIYPFNHLIIWFMYLNIFIQVLLGWPSVNCTLPILGRPALYKGLFASPFPKTLAAQGETSEFYRSFSKDFGCTRWN